MTPTESALRFVAAINAHDVDALLGLMPDDHRFIDSLGNTLSGRESLRSAWKGYFAMVPDYALTVTETLERLSVVALFGTARGSYAVGGKIVPSSHWETPAAWRAVLSERRVAEWRVYADNEPVRDIMRRL